MKTITVSAKQYEDHDDCLRAASDDYVSEHPETKGYDLNPRWVGGEEGEREEITLDVPENWRLALCADLEELDPGGLEAAALIGVDTEEQARHVASQVRGAVNLREFFERTMFKTSATEEYPESFWRAYSKRPVALAEATPAEYWTRYLKLRNEMSTADVGAMLKAAGYDADWTDSELTLSLTDGTQGDGEEVDGEESLAEVRAVVEPLGYQANWTGNGNTSGDGESTSDVRITRADEFCPLCPDNTHPAGYSCHGR